MSKIYRAIGLMSGTSLDGVDAAIMDTDGERAFSFGVSAFRAYTPDEQAVLHKATQAALSWNFKGAPPRVFVQAEGIVHKAHIEAVEMLDVKGADIVGFHGQTILHRSPENGQNGKTLQLGDGQILADALGLDVVYDFRSADMRQGGQGAPLAPVFHSALVSKSENKKPVGVLNVGGVSNITIVTAKDEMFATDCGPGNGPLDSWVQSCGLGQYDEGGALALAGKSDFALIDQWLAAVFFKKPVPKSADRWDFNVLDDMKGKSAEDGAATLVAFTAMSIGAVIKKYAIDLKQLIVCGGGRYNRALMLALQEQGVAQVVSAEQAGWSGNDMEAQAFAYLAVRSLRGLPLSFPHTTGVYVPTTGGILAKP